MTSSDSHPDHQVYQLDVRRQKLFDSFGTPIEIRRQALAVLECLASREGQAVSKSDLLETVWARSTASEDSLVKAIGDVRKALKDNAHELVQTVPTKGYRLQLGVVQLGGVGSSEDLRNTSQVSNHKLVVFCVFAVILVVLGFFFLSHPSKVTPDKPSIKPSPLPRVAIMKFSGKAGTTYDDWLVEGFTENLTAEMVHHSNVSVISRHSSYSVARVGMSASEISEKLNSRFLVDGNIGHRDNQLFVDFEVYDQHRDQVIYSESRSSDAPHLDTLRTDILNAIATAILGQVQVSERLVATSHGASTLTPYLATLRVIARKHRYTSEQYRAARSESLETLEAEPGYAPAWIAMAFVNYLDAVNGLTGEFEISDMAIIEKTVRNGIALDARIPMGWHVLSLIKGTMNEPAEALKAAQHAYRIAPRDPETLLFLSKAMLTNGQLNDAQKFLKEALSGFPIIPSYVQLYRARTFWAAGQLQESVDAANDCILQAPKFTNCWVQKVVSLYEIGDSGGTMVSGDHLKSISPKVNSNVFISDFQSHDEFRERRFRAAQAIGLN